MTVWGLLDRKVQILASWKYAPNASYELFYNYFCTLYRFARKKADSASLELDNAIFSGVNSEIAANFGAHTRALGHADLADDDLADLDFLAAEQLHTEALALAISGIFGGTASFDM
jgi:hypothetical protein